MFKYEDFTSLEYKYKAIIIATLLLTPLFFVSAYFFWPSMIKPIGDNMFSDIDFYIVLILCIVVSALWYIMNVYRTDYLMLTTALMKAPNDMKKTDYIKYERPDPKTIFKRSAVDSIFFLLVFMIINCFIRVHIFYFIFIIFAFIGFLRFLAYIDYLKYKRKISRR
ncbi:MAG: hypothetical protein E2604_05515 [Flavobacterium sp.]|nr:hypothetical protein [Flavobacterium sp.]